MESLWKRGSRAIKGSQLSVLSRQLAPVGGRWRHGVEPGYGLTVPSCARALTLLKAICRELTAIQIVLLSRQWYD